MHTPSGIKLEICLDSVPSAINAQQGGADRVELCDNLLEGGTTPSAGAIAAAREHLTTTGLQVMVRPRGGDFLYDDVEFDIMRRDIEMAKSLGADGIVLGLLNADGSVDEPRTRQLVDLARPLNVTFHRAFDVCRDPFEALETLCAIGVDRILTSGQEPSVLEGADLIRELVERAGDRLVILPGCGITARNLTKILALTGVSEVHVYTTDPVESPMAHRNGEVFMGGLLRPPEYTRSIASPGGVGTFRSLLDES